MNKEQIANTLLRVVLGVIFLAHGVAKFQMGLENVSGWFGSIGLPGFLAYIVAYLELLGGIALIIGFMTRYVSIAFVLLMAGATLKVKLALGLLGNGQMAGYELDLALLAMAAYLAVVGATGLAVDNLFNKKKEDQAVKA